MELSDSDSSLSDDFNRPSKKPKKGGTSNKVTDTEEDPKPQDAAKTVKKKKLYQCQYCPLSFTVKSNCSRHTRVCSFNEEKESNTYVCDKCNACFNRKDNLSSHLKKCTVSEKNASRRKKPCLIKDCDLEFVHHIGLIEHLRSSHQSDVIIKPMVSKTFSSINDFNVWKEKEETDTLSYFVKRRGTAVGGDQHFYCQHDGSEKLHSSRKTSRCNLKGRVKVGHHCIAKMIARVDATSKAVNVEYHPTHSHLCKSEDFLHHPLPDAMSRFIDKKLSENIPPCVVYELTKSQFLPRNDSSTINPRANILTKKRILERGRRRRMARRLHKDDARAVFLMVKQLIDNDDCILYKPYGTGVQHGPEEIDQLPNSKELFMIGLQTPRQLEIFKKHCGKIVILDETHGTNQYKYQLLTAMVVDENRRGWPIAHLITSKSDSATLKYFFKSLKLRIVNECSVGCVITDDDPALINGMNEGFSEHLKHILCIWHVFKNLKDGVRTRASTELFDSILSEVKLIMNTKQEDLFNQLCSGFVKKYEGNIDAVRFVKYFEKYYLSRSEKWAMSFRNFPHAEVNTTGHLESFHNRLKKFYLKRKVNQRLDDLIQILLDVEWDDHCTRQREAAVGFSALPQPMWERHRRGLAIEDDTILEHALENTWEVKSASGKSVSCIVVRHNENCSSDFCYSKCSKPECHGLCAHLFSCSCPDHHPICKHIHKLQSFLMRGKANDAAPEDFYCLETVKDLEFIENEPIFDCNQNNNVTENNNKKWYSMVSRMKENFSLLEKFISAAEQKNTCVAEHTLVHADAVLSDLVQSFASMDFSGRDVADIPEMSPTVQYAPNETLKTQMSQLSSFKRPQKKKSKSDPATIAEKNRTAMESLLLCASTNNIAVDDPDDVYEGFTPSVLYVIDPLDHVLVCGNENLSLIDLKSLELQLPIAEEEICLKSDAIFKCGRLYSSIINAFVSKLCENFDNVSFLSSEFALRAANGYSNSAVLKENINNLNNKNAILVPANITEDPWFILAIMIEEEEIRLYDPCQRPLSQKVLRCLTQTVSDLKAVYPLTSQWKIKIVKFSGEQGDDVNCGPKICLFAEQTAEEKVYTKLNVDSEYEYRRHIYNTIVANCLRRSSYFDEACGKCEKLYDVSALDQIWISCCRCRQWYHEACVVNVSAFFSCP